MIVVDQYRCSPLSLGFFSLKGPRVEWLSRDRWRTIYIPGRWYTLNKRGYRNRLPPYARLFASFRVKRISWSVSGQMDKLRILMRSKELIFFFLTFRLAMLYPTNPLEFQTRIFESVNFISSFDLFPLFSQRIIIETDLLV